MPAYNLNITSKPEYSLNSSMISEYINMYGIKAIFLDTIHKNKSEIFKDFTHNEIRENILGEVFILPENPDTWGETGYNEFGFFNNTASVFYISSKSLKEIFGEDFISKTYNSLLMLPSTSILEITNIEPATGMNNLWAFEEMPNVYAITIRDYMPSLGDEGVQNVKEDVNTIKDDVFEELSEFDDIEDVTNVNNDALNDFIDEILEDSKKENIESKFENEWEKL